MTNEACGGACCTCIVFGRAIPLLMLLFLGILEALRIIRVFALLVHPACSRGSALLTIHTRMSTKARLPALGSQRMLFIKFVK